MCVWGGEGRGGAPIRPYNQTRELLRGRVNSSEAAGRGSMWLLSGALPPITVVWNVRVIACFLSGGCLVRIKSRIAEN